MTTVQRISAVIPCFNGSAFLEEAVRSAMTQTREVDEVIVVDDGSTDDSAAIAERLGATCVRMPRRSGPSAARNRGIASARGDVIAFLDADDYWGRRHCEDVVALLERHPDCDVAFSRVRRFDEVEEALSPPSMMEDVATPVLWHLLRDNFVAQSTAVVRRATLQRHGGYDESRWHSEDYQLWLRLAQHSPFVCTHTVTANWRLHPGQSSRELERMLLGRWEVKHRFWKDATTRETRAFVERLEALLLSVWNATLDGAWWTRDDRLLRAALALHQLIPNSAASYRRWQRRYRRSWKAWLLLSRAWDRLPHGARELSRPALSALFSPSGQDQP